MQSLCRRSLVGIALAARPLLAQADTTWAPRGPLLHGGDVATLAAGAVGAAALTPFDERIARWMQRPTLQRRAGLQHTATAFRRLGDPGVLLIGLATYGGGAVFHDRATADVGLHATTAIVVGSVLGGAIKGTLGRARPYAVADSDAHDFRLGRGFRKGRDYQSLPSGHATAAFAFASTLDRELRHRRPAVGRIAGPIAYGVAGLVALSRLYNDDHWASDIVLGASLGTVSGLATTRFLHGHPRNDLDRRLLPAGDDAPGRRSDAAGRLVLSPPLAVSWTLRF